METLTKKVTIEIDGEKYDDYNFNNISWSQQLLRPNELRFTMKKKNWSDYKGDDGFPTPKAMMGAEVICTIHTERFTDKDELQEEAKPIVFKGIIINVNVYRTSLYSEQLIDVTAFSRDYLLFDHPHCFSYENESLKKIISSTLDPHDIPNEIDPYTTESIPYTVQYNESNYQFLVRLAQRYGEWMYHDGEKLIFGKIKKKNEGNPLVMESRNDIQNYNYQTVLSHHKLKYAHHDYLKYENPIKSDTDIPEMTDPVHSLTDEAEKKSKKWFAKETFQHISCSNPEVNEFDELELSAKAQLLGKKAQYAVCTGSSVRSDLTIGSCIQIADHFYVDSKKDITIFHEVLMIISISHYTEVNGGYRNSFTAVPVNCEYPHYNQNNSYPVSPAQRAKVMDNNDPEKLGRIRVQFLWQEAQDAGLMTPWIRIAQPHGGDDKGFYFIPEIDEEVMVDFENANAEKPFVVGTLYHGKQHPGKPWPTESNDIKAIRTRNGHTIEIHDEGEDGFIRIYDHEKENYILTFSTDEKLIKLESTGNIELYAQNDIILEAKNDIIQKADKNRLSTIGGVDDVSSGSHNYKAEGAIHIEGKTLFAQGKDKAVIDSGSLTQIQCDSTTNVLGQGSVLVGSGSGMEVSAGSTMTIEAEATMKIDAGATMDVKAGAPLTIKGAIVNIN